MFELFRRLLGAAAAALILAPPATAATQARDAAGAIQGATAVARATVITRPGSYVLTRDIVADGEGAAIEIRANEVTLDLAGHRLVGPGQRRGTGVAVVDVHNVRISGGHLARFGIGVMLSGATNVVVEGLQIDGVDSGGAPPDVEIGILLVDTRGARIEHNVITETFLGVFVRGEGSGGNRIADNLFTGGDHGELGICYNPAPGQATGGPSGDLVYGNVVSRFRRAIALSADSAGNVVRENTLAYFDLAIEEATAGANLLLDNDMVEITP